MTGAEVGTFLGSGSTDGAVFDRSDLRTTTAPQPSTIMKPVRTPWKGSGPVFQRQTETTPSRSPTRAPPSTVSPRAAPHSARWQLDPDSDQATTRSDCSTLPLVSGASTSERAKLSAPTQVPIIIGIA